MAERSAVILHAIAALLDDVQALVPPGDRQAFGDLRSTFHGVPTIALAGRVSSGKSTLLNALVGSAVAATDARECTRVATLYEYGAPERVEVVGLDGCRSRVSWSTRDNLGRPPADIDFAVAHTTQVRLRDRFRVIDTPGLSSHSRDSEKATRRALIRPAGLPATDIILFLVEGGHLRADEVEFLVAMGASRLNTILVVSRADTCGDGVLGEIDPFEVARSHAARLERGHGHLTRVAVPVAGLIAESAETGISEQEAATLASYSGLDSTELFFAVDEAETTDPLSMLDAKLGIYGVIHGRAPAAHGAVALSDWLYSKSGLNELNAAVSAQFGKFGLLLKARETLTGIRRMAMTSVDRPRIMTLLENAELSPELHSLRELNSLDNLTKSGLDSALIKELETVMTVDNPHDLLNLGPHESSHAQIEAAALEKISTCRTRKMSSLRSAEREALSVLERSYKLAAWGGQ